MLPVQSQAVRMSLPCLDAEVYGAAPLVSTIDVTASSPLSEAKKEGAKMTSPAAKNPSSQPVAADRRSAPRRGVFPKAETGGVAPIKRPGQQPNTEEMDPSSDKSKTSSQPSTASNGQPLPNVQPTPSGNMGRAR